MNGSITFRLFGIPIVIHPIAWVVLLIIGGGLGINSGEQLASVLLFVVAGMLCLIVHEMGHALAGRHLTGCLPSIDIAGFGGSTFTPRLPRTRSGYFALVAAGPLASLLLGIVGGAIFGLQVGNLPGGIVFSLLCPLPIRHEPMMLLEVYQGIAESGMGTTLLTFYLQLFSVCVWWTIFNLLPIFPLDGGKLLGTLLDNNRLACIIGMIVGGLLCMLCLIWASLGGSWFNLLIVGYLTYINYQYLRQMP